LKKKGIIRKLLLLLLIIGISIYVFKNGYITFDKIPPVIKYSGNNAVFNKNLDNNIIVKDESNIKYIKLYYKSIDTSNEYVSFYSKKVKYKKTNDFLINLKNTKLVNFFSTTTSTFDLKIEAIDNSISSNVKIEEFSFKVDNSGPTIKIIKKSLNMIKKGSLFSLQVELKDNTGIKKILIDNKKDFLVSKGKKKGIYNLSIPFSTYPEKNYITLSVYDVVDNTNKSKIYFLKSKNKIKTRKIIINNKFYNELKNIKTDLKEINTISFLKQELNKEISIIKEVIKIDQKNNKLEYNKIDNYNFQNYFKTKDKIFISSFGTNYEFIKNKTTKLIFRPSFISHKINSRSFIYPIKEGVIIYSEKLNILKNVIIIKSKGNIYTVYMLLQSKKDISNGMNVTNTTKLGKPDYSYVLKTNTALSVYIGKNIIDPSFFLNNKMNNLYIKNVFGNEIKKIKNLAVKKNTSKLHKEDNIIIK